MEQVEWLRGQVEARAEGESELRRLLVQAQAQNAALTARLGELPAVPVVDPAAAASDHHGREQSAAGDGIEQQRRPWWKLWG